MLTQDAITPGLRSRRRNRLVVEVSGLALLCGVVALSAVITKEAQSRSRLDPLAAINLAPEPGELAVQHEAAVQRLSERTTVSELPSTDIQTVALHESAPVAEAIPADPSPAAIPPEYVDAETRFFNGRPVRPARTMWMTVTAYSPDERSCGDSADGITSSIHSVWTNAMRLVAADSRVLPLGSMISVPGYDEGQVVPVLDRGGAIKGQRLDLLYPTHEIARSWGVQRLKVTVWEYADGKPVGNFRDIRDSKH